MASNGSSRTPFDQDLVADPHAPRNTQPLPPSRLGAVPGGPAQAPAQQPVQPSYPPPYQPPPAQSVPGPAPSNSYPSAGLGSGRLDSGRLGTGRLSKVPPATLIGLAMAGGALAVVLLSVVVRKVIKPEPLQHDPAMVVPHSGTPAGDTLGADDPFVSKTPLPGHSPDIAPSSTPSDATAISPDDPASGVARSGTTHNATKGNGTNATTADPTPPGARGNDSDATGTTSTNSGDAAASNDATDTSTSSGGRFTHRRAGYSLTPPAGFRLRSSGRRTTWQGPGGARILVETMATPGREPRRDWERLDAALARKYGSGYVSHGISDTTLGGRPAAAWEFELTTKSGTTRKIDVAVHDKGTGYAVLVSAPATSFDAVRPQLDAALRSFQLPPAGFTPRRAVSRRSHARSTDKQHDDATSNATSDATTSGDGGTDDETSRPGY